jgi:hypothetical protein
MTQPLHWAVTGSVNLLRGTNLLRRSARSRGAALRESLLRQSSLPTHRSPTLFRSSLRGDRCSISPPVTSTSWQTILPSGRSCATNEPGAVRYAGWYPHHWGTVRLPPQTDSVMSSSTDGDLLSFPSHQGVWTLCSGADSGTAHLLKWADC